MNCSHGETILLQRTYIKLRGERYEIVDYLGDIGQHAGADAPRGYIEQAHTITFLLVFNGVERIAIRFDRKE